MSNPSGTYRPPNSTYMGTRRSGRRTGRSIPPGSVQSDASRGEQIHSPKGPSSFRHRPRALQQWLRSMHYNVAVDGVIGDITRSAVDAWRHGIPGRKWTEHSATIDDPNRHNTPNNKSGHRQVYNEPLAHDAHRSGMLPPVRHQHGGTAMPRGSAGGMFPGIDPDMYTKALMDQEYGPILSELMREEKRTRAIGGNREAELKDMYAKLAGDYGTAATADAASRQKTIADIAGIAGGLQGGIAMDSEVAGDVAATGDIAADTARLIDMSESGYERDSANAARLGGLFATGQAHRDTKDAVDEILGKRRDVLAERGAKSVATKTELLKWMTETGLAAKGLGLDEAKFGLDVLNSNRQNRLTNAQIRASEAGITNDTVRAQAALINAQRQKGSGNYPRNFQRLNPAQRSKIGEAIIGSITGGEDQLATVRKINSAMRSFGYKPGKDRAAGRFAWNLYQNVTGKRGDPSWWGLGG